MERGKEESWQGVSGGTLKIIAVVTMLIDHIAATVLMRMLRIEYDPELYMVYRVMRQIGRIAFPIYCFMLVEGLTHTRNRWKYAARLGGMALVSEIPFDLAFRSAVLETGYQNVFFTLTIGLVTLGAWEEIESRFPFGIASRPRMWLRYLLMSVTGAAGMGLAAFLKTDYGWSGVACILILYWFRRVRALQLVMGYLAFVALLDEVMAFPAFVALALYRGRKGVSSKVFFYGFYPVHLLLLYLTCVILEIARVPAVYR
ncbi:MAG: conjugal transfer protein TraX [Clostridium sp.]|nr:conjugal transfer protein TraX [Acetatifactor muris]MCM1526842.1 conjugal transfer protein TraX [Bacteroides sp.]MCM1562958.1 conjugal transfer protein TraX [Clostridium sp.]